MKIPLEYNARSLLQRPVSTLLTALGIALVVAVFIGMLALANGFRAALTKTGSDQNVLVLRRGADSELSSGLDREAASILAASPHVQTGADGRPMVSPEVYVIIPLPRTGRSRHHRPWPTWWCAGISPAAWTVRNNVRIEAGRKPEIGQGRDLRGQEDGGPVQSHRHRRDASLRRPQLDVVCRFSANGSAFESEIWGENEQFMPVFRGEAFQSVTFRLKDPAAFDEAKRTLEADRRLTVDVHREADFYTQQSQLLGRILTILALMITSIMAIGAIFGAINTMYAAVASRSNEIAVLLTLGFHPRSVLASFLAESALIAIVGGVIGALLALPINGIVTSTTNWASFSEIAFSFRVSPTLLLAGLCFAVVMGLIGGFFPARRAAKLPVVQALR